MYASLMFPRWRLIAFNPCNGNGQNVRESITVAAYPLAVEVTTAGSIIWNHGASRHYGWYG